ncbi:uncharacterized protein LOC144606233 [Rhinoraja longicauda]
MVVIQLTILALLVNGLNTQNDLNHATSPISTEELNTTMTASSSTPTPPIPLTTMNMLNATGQTSDLPNTTSDLMSTSSNTSQTVLNHSSETSVSSSASPPTSPVTTVDHNTEILTPPVRRESTTNQGNKDQGTNMNASMIIACIIGGLLLLLVISIIGILLVKRCSRNYNVQDTPWAGTCPVSNDREHPDEGGDGGAAPTKRPSLTSFLSKKAKRDSLLDNYSMEVQANEGVNNLASSETEGKALSADVKGDNETAKEPPALAKTTSQEFLPLLEEHDIPDEDDLQPPPPATDTETSKLSEGLTDADLNNSDLSPPPMDIVDLVNNSELPPPL